ncbi:hypothetical protein [Ornithinibacillus xuwenensis]|uniref:Uncharacterized protein n=1 Tax=Ornithinibacillus xuwenensis TaxID=3144668 RepID=A0ABU9XH49_9BACI
MFFFIIIGFLVFFLFFNWLLGHQKGNIVLDLDDRYINRKKYVAAIQTQLESEGREVTYVGNNIFIIDGKKYMFTERNVSMGGVPLQRTVLQPVD